MSFLKQAAVQAFGAKMFEGASSKLLDSSKPTPFNLAQPRLINRFSLGCDPEFLLFLRGEGVFRTWDVVSADSCGLKLDEAFGADGAGTPVELRAHPSKFAVEIVGSLLETLRWLFVSNSKARECDYWGAGCYLRQYALGGHIHFGRRAGVRDAEVKALGQVCKALEGAGFFPGSAERREKSSYGSFRDWRKQAWGYEYRAFGCFLYSPALAHLLLTLTKLAVLDKRVGVYLEAAGSAVPPAISNILSFYRFLDDDASIAYRGLGTTLKGTMQQNILKSWGLEGVRVIGSSLTKVPSTIPASQGTVSEVVESIRTGRPPSFRPPSHTWARQEVAISENLPVRHLLASPETYLGERDLVSELYAIRGSNLKLTPTSSSLGSTSLRSAFNFALLLSDNEYARFKELAVSIGANHSEECFRGLELQIGRGLRQNAPLRALKRFLGSGVLPLADAEHVTPAWCEMWVKRLKRAGLYQGQ